MQIKTVASIRPSLAVLAEKLEARRLSKAKLATFMADVPQFEGPNYTGMKREEQVLYLQAIRGPNNSVKSYEQLSRPLALKADDPLGLQSSRYVQLIRFHQLRTREAKNLETPDDGRPIEMTNLVEAAAKRNEAANAFVAYDWASVEAKTDVYKQLPPGKGISINFSADAMARPDFATRFAATFTDSNLLKRLTIELTEIPPAGERPLHQDVAQIVANAKRLQKMGVKLAADDFHRHSDWRRDHPALMAQFDVIKTSADWFGGRWRRDIGEIPEAEVQANIKAATPGNQAYMEELKQVVYDGGRDRDQPIATVAEQGGAATLAWADAYQAFEMPTGHRCSIRAVLRKPNRLQKFKGATIGPAPIPKRAWESIVGSKVLKNNI